MGVVIVVVGVVFILVVEAVAILVVAAVLVVAVVLMVVVEVVVGVAAKDVDGLVTPRFSTTRGVVVPVPVDMGIIVELFEAYIICFSTSRQACCNKDH